MIPRINNVLIYLYESFFDSTELLYIAIGKLQRRCIHDEAFPKKSVNPYMDSERTDDAYVWVLIKLSE